MTASLSLEDTIATVLNETFGWWLNPTSPNVKRLAEALRAASVVPAEPATHDGPWPKFCPICLAEFHADGTVTPAVAAVDGEAPA